MKINDLIKAVTKDYMPIKKTVMQAQKEGRELSDEEKNTYFELNTTLEFYKILKGLFMEEITKNKNVFNTFCLELFLYMYLLYIIFVFKTS